MNPRQLAKRIKRTGERIVLDTPRRNDVVDFSSRESIMSEWDKWREYIANGGKGSWPSDAFESLLDHFDEVIEKAKATPED